MTASKSSASAIDRRRFLRCTWAGVGASLGLALLPGRKGMAQPRWRANPFSLGVASGDPAPDEGDKRGYFKATVTQRELRVDLRFVTSVENPNGSGYTERSFVVEDGRPGAQPA